MKPAPSANGTIETLNHFEKIHPKDDLEIKKHRDESIGRNANKKENGKKGKCKNQKYFSFRIDLNHEFKSLLYVHL